MRPLSRDTTLNNVSTLACSEWRWAVRRVNSLAGVPASVLSYPSATARTWEFRGRGIPCSGCASACAFPRDASPWGAEPRTHHSYLSAPWSVYRQITQPPTLKVSKLFITMPDKHRCLDQQRNANNYLLQNSLTVLQSSKINISSIVQTKTAFS